MEPVRVGGLAPEFRLILNDSEAYAEVKPVNEFPMDLAQQVLASAGLAISSLETGAPPRLATPGQRMDPGEFDRMIASENEGRAGVNPLTGGGCSPCPSARCGGGLARPTTPKSE